jgi:hypothetical protein
MKGTAKSRGPRQRETSHCRWSSIEDALSHDDAGEDQSRMRSEEKEDSMKILKLLRIPPMERGGWRGQKGGHRARETT